jgi:hypothetical protein
MGPALQYLGMRRTHHGSSENQSGLDWKINWLILFSADYLDHWNVLWFFQEVSFCQCKEGVWTFVTFTKDFLLGKILQVDFKFGKLSAHICEKTLQERNWKNFTWSNFQIIENDPQWFNDRNFALDCILDCKLWKHRTMITFLKKVLKQRWKEKKNQLIACQISKPWGDRGHPVVFMLFDTVRESRMPENSIAITWHVFQFLKKKNLIHLIKINQSAPFCSNH